MYIFRLATGAVAFASLTLGTFAIPSSAEAARVTPMVTEIAPSGTSSITRIEVTNDEDRDIPFELTMHRGIISEAGEVVFEPADDRFVVFPPQTVIEARSQQVFRVQFLPDAEMDASEVFYASVSQLPVALDPNESTIQMLMRFNVLINVVPSGTSSEPVVDWVKVAERPLPPPQGQDEANPAAVQFGLEVRISNNGTRYFGAGQTDWTISGTDIDGKAFNETFNENRIRESTGLGIVGPDQARIFFIPLDRRLNSESVKISFN